MTSFIPSRILLISILLLSLAACAGADPAVQAGPPVATITAPQPNTTLSAGEEILITFNAADVGGVAQVELSIDGEPVLVEAVEPPVNAYTASYRWRPETPGSHVIELRAFNVNNEPSSVAQTFVTVTGDETTAASAGDAAPTETPTATPTLAPPPATATSTPVTEAAQSSPQAAVSPTATTSQAIVTALVGLNVRLGPGTNYPVIGRLAPDETAPITGRDQFTGWWQIAFSSDQGDRGWVAASTEFTQASNAQNVPVAQAPPPASVATATPLPTATPAPAPLQPVIHHFTANRYTVAAGEEVTLSWDLSNAQAAFLRYDDEEEGVVAPGSKTVSPQQRTTYTLAARNQAGETTAQLTIEIGQTTPTPAPVHRDGKIRIAAGQYVDFDEGFVQDQAGNGTDFQWSGQERRFFPQSGASGTLLDKSYGQITRQDCVNTSYNQPISGVDGSQPVSGCYITSEGRYGKFLVSDWDLSANLTVEWLTWNAS